MNTQQMYDTLSGGERQVIEQMVVDMTNRGEAEESIEALFETTIARFYAATQDEMHGAA